MLGCRNWSWGTAENRKGRFARAALLGAVGLLSVPAAGFAGDGGTAPSALPVITGVQCRQHCPDLDSATRGSLVRVSGQHMGDVDTIVFLGAGGAADDIPAAPVSVKDGWVDVKVPADAATGALRAINSDGRSSRNSKVKLTIAAGATTSSGGLLQARTQGGRMFFWGRHPATVSFVLNGSSTRDVRVDVVRMPDDVSIWHRTMKAVSAGTTHTVRWNGMVGRSAAPNGHYQFRLGVVSGASARTADAPGDASAGNFSLLGNTFPVKGPHTYGDGFGAPRSGHTHQGVDVLSPCGTPLVAARGGVVKYKAYQSAAGNYIVIDAAGTPNDYVYMHLRTPAIVDRGDHVYTGQKIGVVGETGDATACHLHFEMWTGPGWYDGGHPFDPMPALKRWDSWS